MNHTPLATLTPPNPADWTAVPVVRADHYRPDPVAAALERTLGAGTRWRSGVARRRTPDGGVTEWQFDEGTWRAIEDAAMGNAPLPDTLYVTAGRTTGLELEVLA